MNIRFLEGEFTVCKVSQYSSELLNSKYCFIGKTMDENSLVCLAKDVPSDVIAKEDGWNGFFIEGILDFSLIGILAKISTLLAKEGISIFAVSTYNTDYIFVKKEHIKKVEEVLLKNNYDIRKGR